MQDHKLKFLYGIRYFMRIFQLINYYSKLKKKLLIINKYKQNIWITI
jgi:hypothetical protein